MEIKMQWVKNKQKSDRSEWHLWFAWWPVSVITYKDGNEKVVWFEKVLRRLVLRDGKIQVNVAPYWIPEYRERPEQPNVSDKPTYIGPINPSGLPTVTLDTPMPEVDIPASPKPPPKNKVSWDNKYGNGKKKRKR